MTTDITDRPVLAYLSGAPRVSTHRDAPSGPRSHVLGTIQGFESNGWQVRSFIVGDRLPQSWSSQSSEGAINHGVIRPLTADLLRIAMGVRNARSAWREVGKNATWAYERNAVMQSLGGTFQRKGIPWILETNAPLFYEAKSERKTIVLSRLARQIELEAYKKCDVLVCITETLRDIIASESQIAPEKTIVLPNGVDTDFFDPARYDPYRLFDGFTIGFVGKLFGWQGVDLLLEAIAKLVGSGIDIKLVVIGDGAARPKLESLVDHLGLRDRVVLLGQIPRETVPAYIAGFDIGYSGQVQLPIGVMYRSPLKLYEYLAMGTPVIASAFEEANRLIEEGRNGFLFEPGSLEGLKRAICRAYERREALAAMGTSARPEIVRNHSWHSRIARLIKQAHEILK